MGVIFPTKTTAAFDHNTISGNPVIRQAYTSANIHQAGSVPVQRTAPAPVQPSVQRTTPAPAQPPVQRTAPAPAQPPVQRTASASVQPSVQRTNSISIPAVPPIPSSSTLLQRGQKFNVKEKSGWIPSDLKLLLNWEVIDSRCDLDASAFLLGERDLVPGEDWFVFYGQPESPDQSVHYSGNAGTGAVMDIHLTSVNPQIQKIAFAITIYEAIPQRLHFGMVRNVTARLLNAQNQVELARIELTDTVQGITALVVGELYRHKGVWKFNAVGSGVKRDLAGFCAMYGIDTE